MNSVFNQNFFFSLVEGIDSEEPLEIQLGKVVTKISVDDTGNHVMVTSQDGGVWTADHVVVSVPLGVLKEEGIKFEPVLPEEKTKAIKERGKDFAMIKDKLLTLLVITAINLCSDIITGLLTEPMFFFFFFFLRGF